MWWTMCRNWWWISCSPQYISWVYSKISILRVVCFAPRQWVEISNQICTLFLIKSTSLLYPQLLAQCLRGAHLVASVFFTVTHAFSPQIHLLSAAGLPTGATESLVDEHYKHPGCWVSIWEVTKGPISTSILLLPLKVENTLGDVNVLQQSLFHSRKKCFGSTGC